ncbi:MAG: PhnD/SsuA/transferrin family substrate-binding protein [Gemmataceae bacterium]|nr:phosphate/phosphite/phosphonate ABC transporter substrate-binding protein [Gemmata sp.]MDW8197523.1 PhnD/SsuA/transferrin family substrate-binding protein [Gemmataceae bacterium]
MKGFILPVAVAVLPILPLQAADPPLRIAMPQNMFNGVPAGVIGPAAKPFQSMFEKQTGFQGNIIVAKDWLEITDKLRKSEYDVAVLHGFEYSWVKNDNNLVPLLISVPSSKLEACLVVHVNSRADTPADLKGNSVAIPASTKAFCHLYFDRLKINLPAGCCCPAQLNGHTVEDALDAVATGQCPAALVDAMALKGYQSNKPGVGKQLRILHQSPAFPPAVIVYRKGIFTTEAEKRVIQGMIKGTTTPQGKVLTGLWKIQGFSEVTAEYLADLENCCKMYPPPNNVLK